MKGILVDSYYKTLGGMKLLLGLLSFVGALIILFIKIQFIVEGYMLLVFFCVPIYALLINSKDTELAWSQYELILPIKKDNIVKSKYFIYLFWLFLSFVFNLLYIKGVLLFEGYKHFDLGFKDIETIFILAVSFGIQLCAWFYPIWYVIDFTKREITIFISGIVTLFNIIGLTYFLNINGIILETGRRVVIINSILMFIISYFISKKIYKNKEF